MAVTTEPSAAELPAAGPGAITGVLAQITSRLRLVRWVSHAARGGLTGTVPALIAVVLAHFDLWPDWLPLEAAIPIPIALGLAAGTVTTFLRPISPMDAARLAEARLGLKERLSSALEFEQSPQSADPEAAALRRLQMADAAFHARSLKSADAVPIRLPWEAKAFAGALVLIALALIVPSLPVFVPPGVQLERQIVQKTGAKLQNSAKLIQKQADAQHLPGTKRTAAQIQQLAKRMQAGRMDKKQAMVQMSKLTSQMRQEQQQAAQANSGAGGKSLADAGRQLAQALAGGQSSAGASGKQAGAGQKTGGSGQKGSQKSGPNAGASGKPGASPQNGFNVPTGGGKPGASQTPGQTPPSSPEVQKAAEAMQQNDSQALSQQLRQAADKIQSGHMTPAQQQQTAADLQKLADALKNTPMPETQKHAQAAADALKRGDKQAAVSELRKAAASAEKEAQQQADQQAQSDAAQGIEDAQSQMAGANSPGDVSDSPSQPGSGEGKGKGAGKGAGSGQGDGLGDGSGLQNSQGKHGSGKGNGGSGGGGKAGGTPRDTGNGSSPLKHLGKATPNPQGVKLYFGRPLNSGPSKTGPAKKVGANPNAVPGQTPSRVPYYNYVGPAQKSAESAMDKEDIPPAYRSDVRRYFNSLNPPAGGR